MDNKPENKEKDINSFSEKVKAISVSKRMVIRILISLFVLGVVFCAGVKVGEIKTYFNKYKRNDYYGQRMMYGGRNFGNCRNISFSNLRRTNSSGSTKGFFLRGATTTLPINQ